MNKVDKVLSDRGSEYGKFSDVSNLYYDLKRLISEYSYGFEHKVKTRLDKEAECSLDMVCMKIARLVCGSRCHRDSWLDIAGYAMLVVEDIDAMNDYNKSSVTICNNEE